MALIINNAILHILHRGGSRISNVELDIDSETCYEFIGQHVRRLMRTPGAREATFTGESQVYALVKGFQQGNLHFKELSLHLCDRLERIMSEYEEIPSGDLLIVFFSQGKSSYLAIIQLSCGECFTHRILEKDGSVENHIVKNIEVLPKTANKVTAACLIPYDPMILRVTETPLVLNSEEIPYFSQLFLECETKISKKETAQIIQEVAQEVNERYFGGDNAVEAQIKQALIEETEAAEIEDENVNLSNIARRAFPENPQATEAFVAMTGDAGLPHEVKLDKPFIQRQFKTHLFKADNGIELKFPLELFQNPETVQMVKNSDGSVSFTIKNLRQHIE